MKLYDVIRKENISRGKKSKEVSIEAPDIQPHHIPVHKKPFTWRKWIVVGLAGFFIVLLYIIGMNVVRAKVIIDERRIPFMLEDVEFELVHEGEDSTGRLSFQTMVVSTEVSRQVYGSEVEPSTSIAKGKVVIFNEYSTKPQTIKAKTVLVGANNKNYQTTTAVVVPGYTLKGKVKTAGTSVATPIVAVAVGPSYNTNGTNFTVKGWTAKQMYAQSAGAITGGEDGVAHTLSDEEYNDVTASLQAQLSERLKRETRAQIPEHLITFPDLQVTTIDSDSLRVRGSTIKFPASIQGSMTTYLINRELLETAIANHVLRDRPYAQVSIPAIASLSITPGVALPSDAKNTPETIKVRITGEGTIITKAPVAVIRESLLGASKKNFASLLSGVPEVASAQYRFYPFWAPFFPSKDSRITITVQ